MNVQLFIGLYVGLASYLAMSLTLHTQSPAKMAFASTLAVFIGYPVVRRLLHVPVSFRNRKLLYWFLVSLLIGLADLLITLATPLLVRIMMS